MKKFLALLLALAMTLALVACGEKKDDTKTDGAGDGEKTYKVAMICDSSINDGGWGAACYNAMVKAAEDKGLDLRRHRLHLPGSVLRDHRCASATWATT